MKKTMFVVYEDEVLTDTGGKQDLQSTIIGKYKTKQEACDVYHSILNDKPEDVDIEIRVEQEEVEVSDDMQSISSLVTLPSQTTELFVLSLQSQMSQMAKLLNNQINIIDNLNRRVKELEKIIN